MPATSWPAITAARRLTGPARVPVYFGSKDTAVRVGSVALPHLIHLRRWAGRLALSRESVHLTCPPDDIEAVLIEINQALRDANLVGGWRDERFTVWGLDTGQAVTRMERAALRFWGGLTQGAHANGYVANAAGRPTHLWLARRSTIKATDPGLWDNLIGGGVGAGQTPLQALVREGFEEAGLSPEQMDNVSAGRVLRLQRSVAAGLQLEDLYSHDLKVPAGWVPANQDGEVAGFELLPIHEALALAAGPEMTVDAALVTLDFALRHGLCNAPPGAEALWARSAKDCD